MSKASRTGSRYLFNHHQPIAQGAATKVLKATYPGSNEIFAVKIIDLNNKSPDFIARARQEAHLHLILSGHRNIIRTFDVFEENSHLHIVMEYIGCDLLSYLSDRQCGLTEPESRHIFKQIRKAVSFLHRKMIVHGDIKLENILIDAVTSRVVLIDFGSASRLKQKNQTLNILSGTQQYVAPEVVLGEHYDGCRSDIYSLGVVLFGISTNRLPFDDEDGIYYYSWVENYHEALGSGVCRMLPPVPLSPQLMNLLQKMLSLDPNERLTMKRMKRECWLKRTEGVKVKEVGKKEEKVEKQKTEKKKRRISQWFAKGATSLFS